MDTPKTHSKRKSDTQFLIDNSYTSEGTRLKSNQDLFQSSRQTTRQLEKRASNSLIKIKTRSGF